MGLIQFVKKHPWVSGGAILGIVGGLIMGTIMRAILDFTSSEETVISIILLIAYTGLGILDGAILGAIYRKVQSKQLFRRYRWWTIAGIIYGGFSGMLGGASFGWGVGQLITGETGEATTGIIISLTIAIVWGIITASLSAFSGAIFGAITGAIIEKRFLYVVWLIFSLYVCIQYSDRIIIMWRNVVMPFAAFSFTLLLVTGLGWAIIKQFELQPAFEQGIQKQFSRLRNIMRR